MGKLGCSIDGNLNEAKFSEPMPWIGIYVAAASIACAIAMAADLVHGFRSRKFWFPTKYFCFNATSLTIISVAIKLSVDLNTPMPRRVDQLAKLSSGVLLCIIMGNSMPSLGSMENSEIFMNMMALAILIITVIVNICIQLATGVIYLFWREHAFTMFVMLVLLLILSFSALTVPTTKNYLEHKYKKRYEIALKEGSDDTDRKADKKLREDLLKLWMMAHTSSPQFVMGRSVTCVASGALCLLSALTLAETMLRSYLMPGSFKFCNGESDYKWASTLILIAQTIAVGVGTIAPAIRWFTAVNFRCPKRGKKSCKRVFTVERYWTQILEELKDCPLTIRIHNRRRRKLVHDAKNLFLDMCCGTQKGIVLTSLAVQFISVYFVSRILLFSDFCRKLKLFRSNNSISIDSGSESQPSHRQDLSRFVLHLQGEEELVDLMMKNNRDATSHWMQKGNKKQPKHLIELLEKSNHSEGFRGVKGFDSDLVPSLDGEEPPNCWALPVATLTAIAMALPNVSSHSRKQLISSVHEGTMYIKLIEDNLDPKKELINIRKGAYVVWQGVDLYNRWLDVDLHKASLQAESTKEILQRLSDAAKKRFTESMKTFMNQCHKENPSKWPVKALAANSMYRISQTILQNHETRNDQMGERLFEALTVMISDILAACLTNLQRVISLECLNSTVELREESIRHAVFLLGKTEKIMKVLDQKTLPDLGPDQMVSIDEWCSLYKLKNPLSSSEKCDLASSAPSDLYLTIEEDLQAKS